MELGGPDISEIRSLAERSRSLLGEMRAKAAAASSRRRDELDRFGGDATQLIERIAAQIASELADDLTKRHAADQETHRQEVAALRESIDADRAAWLAERTEWEGVRDEVEAELAARETALAAAEERFAAESARDDSQRQAEVERLNAQIAELTASVAALEANLIGERTSAAATHQSLASADASIAELQGKFDLALGDLGRHRARVAELEGELASRPTPDGLEAAELVALRQERDNLAAQVAELLAAPAPFASASDDEHDDLRRRFEMAVEDIRQLRTTNAELEDRLAKGGSGAVADTGGNDWESQKRRLIAALESEGEASDSHRHQERATIQGTIQITDGVVAEKDREIERLRSELEAASGVDLHSVDAATAALIDEDEVVRAARERVQALEATLEEKVRAAELELSIGRAKIARAQSELEEQALELQTLRGASAGPLGQAAGGEARRNWLNKLGLGGTEG
jgi:DNA repair exonuclease SbcCD ATPase subunit